MFNHFGDELLAKALKERWGEIQTLCEEIASRQGLKLEINVPDPIGNDYVTFEEWNIINSTIRIVKEL